ncbi:unnamed protein product [Caenorhabditis nigoni]
MILVVDVFNQKMTSLLIATCILFTSVSGQAAITPPYKVSPWSLAGPISSLQGTYQMRTTLISEYPPSLASVWELGSADFNIVIWPPKHCQAVQVFFINKKHKGIGRFHIETDMVKNESLTFYPPIQKLEVITGKGGTPKTYFNQRSSIPFVNYETGKYKLQVTESEVRKINDYNKATAGRMTEIDFNLSDKIALMVTNSRFCFAHITRDGSESSYDALFDPEVYEKPDELPQVLTISNKKTRKGYVPSLFHPLQSSWAAVSGVKKTVDLLPVLKNPEFHDKTAMRQKSHCNGFVSTSRNPLKRAIGVISVDSWEVNDINAHMSTTDFIDDHFIVSIGQTCSWIRLWITDKDNTMEKYGNMKLSETIDIFFNQQFFVGPDSDEARPLSGNSTQIDRIAIRRHWDHSDSKGEGVAQMSYGRDGGQNFPYIEYFKMDSLSNQNIRINLIKAKSCQANIITSPQTRLSSANKPTPNYFEFVSCERFLLNNENTHDKSNE